MVTKVHHIQSQAGVKDFKALINDFRALFDLLRDQEKYSEMLDELNATCNKAEEKIELAGAAEEVVSLRETLLGKDEEYKRMSADLARDRKKFTTSMSSELSKQTEKLEQMESEKKSVWSVQEKKFLAWSKDLKVKENQFAVRSEELSKAETKLASLTADANQKKEEYGRKLARLKAAASGL